MTPTRQAYIPNFATAQKKKINRLVLLEVHLGQTQRRVIIDFVESISKHLPEITGQLVKDLSFRPPSQSRLQNKDKNVEEEKAETIIK